MEKQQEILGWDKVSVGVVLNKIIQLAKDEHYRIDTDFLWEQCRHDPYIDQFGLLQELRVLAWFGVVDMAGFEPKFLGVEPETIIRMKREGYL
jgi:hypothetical protein